MLTDKLILIVEDNAFIAMDLALVVEDLDGVVGGPVASVAQALDLLAIRSVAGAVLDCELNDRDITPVALHLVERGVPFVLYTGTGPPQGLAHMLFDKQLLIKPMRPEDVLAALIAEMSRLSSTPQSALH